MKRIPFLLLLVLGPSLGCSATDRVTVQDATANSGGSAAKAVEEAPTPQPSRVDYRVERVKHEEQWWLGVELRLVGSESGVTRIGKGLSYGPVSGLDKLVVDYSASNADGEMLEVGDIQRGSRDFYFEVRHEPSAPIVVNYRVGRELEPRRESTAGLYRPYVDDSMVHFIGHTVWLRGQHTGRLIKGTVEFVGFDDPAWRVRSTLPGDGRRFHFEGPGAQTLGASVFCAGPDAEVRTVSGGEHDVDVAMIDVSLDPDRLAESIGALVSWQREFFDDQDYPNFLVTVLGASPRVARDYVFESETGAGLTNGFAAYVGTNHTFDDPKLSLRLVGLLAHELLHIWFGPSLLKSPARGEASWFWEGFTTYYTPESLRRAGLLTQQQYIDMVNDYVTEYLHSVYKTASNEEAARYMWENRQAKRLAYVRGAVIAAMLAHELRRGGEYTLDQFVRAMAKEARKNGPFSHEQLFAMVESWTTAEFGQWFRERAIDGMSIEPPNDLYGDAYELEPYEQKVQRYRVR